MSKFYIDKNNIINNKVLISRDESRHIIKVLRYKIDDLITLFDSEGMTYECVIKAFENERITAEIIEKIENKNSETTKIVLAQAVLKSKKMDSVIQKSTELGISRIIPFFSSRTIPKWNSDKCFDKAEHWRNIVKASVKQSGIRKMPCVDNIISYDEIISSNLNMNKILLYEKERNVSFKKIINTITFPSDILIMVGPEGGFTIEEVSKAKQSDFIITGIGKLILRAETVPIAILSILQYEAGNLGFDGG
jgi:16S rRNA (uracil1498-N3)-methyltransferase